MKDILRINDLQIEFITQAGVIRAVDGISLRVRHGSTVALVGESGSGKSVTAQAIMGILPRTARITGGQILFSHPDDKSNVIDLAKLSTVGKKFRTIRGNHISIIFQEPMTSLSPLHTIGDQISEALLLHQDVSRKEGYDATVEMLRLVGFPDYREAYNSYPFELSGGLRQRAMISMALVCRPALLIADEPSTALDVTIQAQILKLTMELKDKMGMAMLLITHDLGVVANIAEEVVVAYQGKIMESGTLHDIFNNPCHPYLKALLGAVPDFDMKPGERLTPLREIHYKPGKQLPAGGVHQKTAKTNTPLLEVRGVSKSFTQRKKRGFTGANSDKTIKVVNNVSFYIRRGECLGLVGESGCGKTTLSKIILRAIDADCGQVLFDDNGDIINLLDIDRNRMVPLRRKFQYVFQDPFGSLNPRMTVYDILGEPFVIHDIGDEEYRREMVIELMRLVGLDARFLNRYPHSFSGGQRQRIGIARALALKPELLICDEPVSALDVSIQAQILNLLKDIRDELNLTYLFITHNLAVVKYIADRIAVMCAGQIVEIAPCELLFKNPVHPYTQALLSAVPHPDPTRRLNFSEITDGKASDPERWPSPFFIEGKETPDLVDLGGEHFVRCHNNLQNISHAAATT